jgi:ribosomal protein S27AE
LVLNKVRYWLDTHTSNPIAWPYVLLMMLYYRLAQNDEEIEVTKAMVVCPHCGFDQFTEQGLCERCGDLVIY